MAKLKTASQQNAAPKGLALVTALLEAREEIKILCERLGDTISDNVGLKKDILSRDSRILDLDLKLAAKSTFRGRIKNLFGR